jgi:hypothetical protein
MTASGLIDKAHPRFRLFLQRAPALAGLSGGIRRLYTSLLADEGIKI